MSGSSKQSGLIAVLLLAVIGLGGYIYWQNGNADCQKKNGPIMESRFNLLKRGCEIKIGNEWKTADEIKDSVTQGVKEMQDGAKKAVQGILGAPNGK